MSRKKGPPRKEIFGKTNGYCWYCGDDIDIETFERDHVVPKIKGGANLKENLVPSCKSCNSSKQSRGVEDLRRYLSKKRLGYIHFTDEQMSFLENNGVIFPRQEMFVFYHEKMERSADNEPLI